LEEVKTYERDIFHLLTRSNVEVGVREECERKNQNWQRGLWKELRGNKENGGTKKKKDL